jgi:transcriptional regulator with XRE-family HTH domain
MKDLKMRSKQNTPGKIFGQIMMAERTKRKISIASLSAELRLEAREIEIWESGKRNPRIGTAMRWAKALGYELELRRVSE